MSSSPLVGLLFNLKLLLNWLIFYVLTAIVNDLSDSELEISSDILDRDVLNTVGTAGCVTFLTTKF